MSYHESQQEHIIWNLRKLVYIIPLLILVEYINSISLTSFSFTLHKSQLALYVTHPSEGSIANSLPVFGNV